MTWQYARYYGQVIGSEALDASLFADLWSRLAARFRTKPGDLDPQLGVLQEHLEPANG